jgi:hypothetical protein
MSTASGTVAPGVPVIPSLAQRDRDHRFFTGMAAVVVLIALIGFGPTYYFRGFTGVEPLSTLVHLHGAAATAWLLLLFGQTSLVAVGRTDLHRRLGIAGVSVAVLFTAIGYVTAIEGARRGVAPPGSGLTSLQFLVVPLFTLLSFVLLAGLGIASRRRRETHRRLMLLATIAMLVPAFARMRWIGSGGPPVAISGTTLLVIACMVWDRRAHGRIHPAFLWGGGLLILSLPLRFALTRLDVWETAARWLTR